MVPDILLDQSVGVAQKLCTDYHEASVLNFNPTQINTFPATPLDTDPPTPTLKQISPEQQSAIVLNVTVYSTGTRTVPDAAHISAVQICAAGAATKEGQFPPSLKLDIP